MDWGPGLMGFKRLEVLRRDGYDVVEILVKMQDDVWEDI